MNLKLYMAAAFIAAAFTMPAAAGEEVPAFRIFETQSCSKDGYTFNGDVEVKGEIRDGQAAREIVQNFVDAITNPFTKDQLTEHGASNFDEVAKEARASAEADLRPAGAEENSQVEIYIYPSDTKPLFAEGCSPQ